MKNELYLNKSIVRRWKKESSTYTDIIIFSPYITSKTAEIVTGKTNNCTIYTLFESEVFINNGSSLITLIKLKKKGIELFSLKRLHAKLFLFGDDYITIGSQNLTTRGHSNIEGTIISNDKNIIKEVKSIIANLESERSEITFEMLDEMRLLIMPLVKKFKLIKEHSELIDIEIEKNELERKSKKEEEKLRNNILEKERLRKANELRKLLIESKKSNIQIYGMVKLVSNTRTTSTYSFQPIKGDPDLINWRFNLDRMVLKKFYRYLCIIEETGKLAWVRMTKTRFTFFASGVALSQRFKFKGLDYNIEFSAIWDLNSESKYNLVITIKPYLSNFKINFNAWFNITTLEIDAIENSNNDIISTLMLKNIMKYKNIFVKQVIEILLQSFKYSRKLTGVDAKKYFGGTYNVFKLTLYDINKQPLLVFNEGN